MLLYIAVTLSVFLPAALVYIVERARLPLQDRGLVRTYVVLAVLWSTPFSFWIVFWALELRTLLRLPWIRIGPVGGPLYLSFAAVLIVISLLGLMTARPHRLFVIAVGVVTYVVWATILGTWAVSQYRG